MKQKLIICYVYPDFGGVADYSKRIESIYRSWKDTTLHEVVVKANMSPIDLSKAIIATNADVVHFEMGGSDWKMYAASRQLLERAPKVRQIVTIHDTGIILSHPSGWILPPGRTPLLVLLKTIRIFLEKIMRLTVLSSWIKDKRITLIALREHALPGLTYLPHVLIEETIPTSERDKNKIFTIGFVGYWSPNKGIETLIEAYNQIRGRHDIELQLKIYGGPAGDEDNFSKKIRAMVQGRKDIVLCGKIPDGGLPQTIANLNLIALPYWLDNPAGSSGIAIHSALSGTPAVSSRAPQLVETFGGGANYYSPADDKDALAAALVGVINQYQKALIKAEKLQSRIVSERSIKVIGERLRKIYLENSII